MESIRPVKPGNHLLGRALLALLVASFSLASVAQQTGRIPLPDLGNSANNYLSSSEEKEYARAMLMKMRELDLLVEDPLIREFFSDMGYRLVAHSDRPETPFTFVVLDEERLNAFAAPGGVVALHSGLILAAEDEHEVAGVLAHEIAHVTQLHIYRTLESTQRMTIPIALGMLGLILAGGASGQAVTGALLSGQAMAQQAYINFTRHNETEADRIGIKTLSLAGYDPVGMADFFDRINRISRANGEGPPEFLRTHPVTVNRVAEAKNRAASMPRPEPSDGLDFYLAQARVRAVLENNPRDTVAYFRDKLNEPHPGAQSRAHQYGLAIALQRRHELDQARELLNELLAVDDSQLAYQLQMADLELEAGENEAALQRLGSLYHSFPGSHAISLQYSDALLRQDDPQRAETASVILRQQILRRDNDPRLYELYARAANIAGDKVRAAEAIAESYYRRGGIREAMQQLEMLTRRNDLDYYERARVSARLEEMRVMMSEFGEEPDEAS